MSSTKSPKERSEGFGFSRVRRDTEMDAKRGKGGRGACSFLLLLLLLLLATACCCLLLHATAAAAAVATLGSRPYLRISDERPRDGHPLLLPPAKACSSLPHQGVVSFRQTVNETVITPGTSVVPANNTRVTGVVGCPRGD